MAGGARKKQRKDALAREATVVRALTKPDQAPEGWEPPKHAELAAEVGVHEKSISRIYNRGIMRGVLEVSEEAREKAVQKADEMITAYEKKAKEGDFQQGQLHLKWTQEKNRITGVYLNEDRIARAAEVKAAMDVQKVEQLMLVIDKLTDRLGLDQVQKATVPGLVIEVVDELGFGEVS